MFHSLLSDCKMTKDKSIQGNWCCMWILYNYCQLCHVGNLNNTRCTTYRKRALIIIKILKQGRQESDGKGKSNWKCLREFGLKNRQWEWHLKKLGDVGIFWDSQKKLCIKVIHHRLTSKVFQIRSRNKIVGDIYGHLQSRAKGLSHQDLTDWI